MAKKTPQKKAKKGLFEALGWLMWKILGFLPRLVLKLVKVVLGKIWASLGRAGFPVARRQVQAHPSRK